MVCHHAGTYCAAALRGTDLCGPPQAQRTNSLSRVPPGVGASGLEAAPRAVGSQTQAHQDHLGALTSLQAWDPWISGWGQGRSQEPCGHPEARTCQGF